MVAGCLRPLKGLRFLSGTIRQDHVLDQAAESCCLLLSDNRCSIIAAVSLAHVLSILRTWFADPLWQLNDRCIQLANNFEIKALRTWQENEGPPIE